MESKRVYLILAIVVVTVIAVVFHLRENNKAKLLEMKVAPNQTKFDINNLNAGASHE